MNVLDRIVDDTRDEVARRRERVPLAQLERALDERPQQRPFQEALTRPGVSLIAEHKRRSPSAGLIREGATVPRSSRPTSAAARPRCRSSPSRSTSAARSTTSGRRSPRPTCRSCARTSSSTPTSSTSPRPSGADAILLIVAALDPDDLYDLLREARDLDLDALVEVHDERELDIALDVEADVLGLNNRDLTDFSVDIERTFELLADVPAGKTVVAESGYSSRDQLDELERVGVDAVLIGETLMRAPDIEAACTELTAGTEHDR